MQQSMSTPERAADARRPLPLPKAARRLAMLVVATLTASCGRAADPPGEATLSIAAFSVVREAYDEAILPAFARAWQAKTGQRVRFEASYGASGAESRAVALGLEADVVALSMPADVERIRRAGLSWSEPRIATTSLVVLGVRPGNPKRVRDFADLARPDVSVLLPNPATSGGAEWNVAAMFGAALRGTTTAPPDDRAAAGRFLADVLGRVEIMDRSGRESAQTFERGMGDVVVTYENEILVAKAAGRAYDEVIPRATLRIVNPVAIVDRYADAHGRRALAEAFVAFVGSREAQLAFARYGLRPAEPEVARDTADQFPHAGEVFTIEDLGGFDRVHAELFGPDGLYARAVAVVEARR